MYEQFAFLCDDFVTADHKISESLWLYLGVEGIEGLRIVVDEELVCSGYEIIGDENGSGYALSGFLEF